MCHKSKMKLLPLRTDNTLVQSTERPCNGSPPPTLQTGHKQTQVYDHSTLAQVQSDAVSSFEYFREYTTFMCILFQSKCKAIWVASICFDRCLQIKFNWLTDLWIETHILKILSVRLEVFDLGRCTSFCGTDHRRGWSWVSSAGCRGRFARGQSTPGWWRDRLPPSTLGSLQRDRDLPAHLSRTGHTHTSYGKQQWCEVQAACCYCVIMISIVKGRFTHQYHVSYYSTCGYCVLFY